MTTLSGRRRRLATIDWWRAGFSVEVDELRAPCLFNAPRCRWKSHLIKDSPSSTQEAPSIVNSLTTYTCHLGQKERPRWACSSIRGRGHPLLPYFNAKPELWPLTGLIFVARSPSANLNQFSMHFVVYNYNFRVRALDHVCRIQHHRLESFLQLLCLFAHLKRINA